MQATLHYIFDPLCGWCYAAKPLLRHAVAALGDALDETFDAQLTLRFHPGLLFEEPRSIDAGFRGHIIEADQRIHELTGVPFGSNYVERIRSADTLVFDSRLPACAVLVAEQLVAGHGLDMLEVIQAAHYQSGLDVCNEAQLATLATRLGFEQSVFSAGLAAVSERLPAEARKARAMLQASGGRGFPTFVLENGHRLIRLDHARAFGRPEAFTEQIKLILTGVTA